MPRTSRYNGDHLVDQFHARSTTRMRSTEGEKKLWGRVGEKGEVDERDTVYVKRESRECRNQFVIADRRVI